jgi:hypothetical protein
MATSSEPSLIRQETSRLRFTSAMFQTRYLMTSSALFSLAFLNFDLSHFTLLYFSLLCLAKVPLQHSIVSFFYRLFDSWASIIFSVCIFVLLLELLRLLSSFAFASLSIALFVVAQSCHRSLSPKSLRGLWRGAGCLHQEVPDQ